MSNSSIKTRVVGAIHKMAVAALSILHTVLGIDHFTNQKGPNSFLRNTPLAVWGMRHFNAGSFLQESVWFSHVWVIWPQEWRRSLVLKLQARRDRLRAANAPCLGCSVGWWAGWVGGMVGWWEGGLWVGGLMGRWEGGLMDRWEGGLMGRWEGGLMGRWEGELVVGVGCPPVRLVGWWAGSSILPTGVLLVRDAKNRLPTLLFCVSPHIHFLLAQEDVFAFSRKWWRLIDALPPTFPWNPEESPGRP